MDWLSSMTASASEPPPSPTPAPAAADQPSTSEPLLFLDIDGVICCNYECRLEEDKLRQLKRIHKATACKIVISSDWRKNLPMKQKLQRALDRLGIPCIGSTPVAKTNWKQVGNWKYEIGCRPMEIVEWLRKYRRHDLDGLRWAAIDDRDLLNEVGGADLVGHMVRTEMVRGLTADEANLAIEILQGVSRA